MDQVLGGIGGKGGNRITLLRRAGNGVPELRTLVLDGLNSPFGVALVGNDFDVANTHAASRYPYVTGGTKIGAGKQTGRPAWRPDRSPLDRERARQPTRASITTFCA